MRSILWRTFGVYQIRCKATGDLYVGSTIVSFNARWTCHRRRLSSGGGNKNLRKAWTEYGPDGFDFIVIETIDDKADVLAREQFWIDSIHPHYNTVSRAGSTIGYKHTESTKRLLGDQTRGRKLSDEHKRKIGQAGIGRKGYERTEEQRQHLSKLLKGRHIQPVGYKHTDETREKLRLSHVGKKAPEEQRKNQSIAITKWWASRRHIQ